MDTSIEAHWQSQKTRRHRIIKIMLLCVFGFAFLLTVLWFWATQPLFTDPVVNTKVFVDPEQLKTHVRVLAQELSPRDEGHPENLNRVAAYIRSEFAKAGAGVSEQPYEVEGNTYRNVIAVFGPNSEQRLIVGAHYDTAGPLPGADDNATGVAGLLELASLLGKQQLPMRVELVAFSLEEPPYFRTAHMGSAIHAASLLEEGVQVKAMLSLEMIGYFSDEPGSQRYPASFLGAFYPSEGNFIGVVGTLGEGLLVRRVKTAMRGASSLLVYSINAPAFVPGVDFSDQLNYSKAGYNSVMITDTAFYRNPNYHTVEDTPEKLDYRRMAMVVQGVYAAVTALAR